VTISVWVVVLLFWVHVLADFVAQTDEMATRKSSSNEWLLRHVLTYGTLFAWTGPWYCIANMALHFATDYVSSRITSRLWKAGRRHAFFVVIGIDQALHLSALVLTWPWLGRVW
jgi:Na+/proline symporter